MNLKKALVVYTKPVTKEDNLTYNTVREVLQKEKLKALFIEKDSLQKKHFTNKDIVFSLGGDGTFLKAAHFLESSVPIFGINSDIHMKEGFFLKSDRRDFGKNVGRLLEGKYRILPLARLEASINRKKLPDLALNEFYIGSEREYITSRYYIKVGKIEERQKSSGIIIATPAGTYAWIRSCGGKKLRLTARKFEYAVREPYKGKIAKRYRLQRGILKEGAVIAITSDMCRGLIVADSMGSTHYFSKNDRIVIQLSKHPINAIFF